ncbi:hypothetical protein Hypma_016108 [Hypsizygus marmoreus]|uniref:Uncharacterized protein n=1 Tax=Hypsizygus marmoreus TaxID=39966 RepID=A0A369KDR5_HYPMA|nr:hypothetical protein Hypma_016108 [Hypsizygus marmoreus]
MQLLSTLQLVLCPPQAVITNHTTRTTPHPRYLTNDRWVRHHIIVCSLNVEYERRKESIRIRKVDMPL